MIKVYFIRTMRRALNSNKQEVPIDKLVGQGIDNQGENNKRKRKHRVNYKRLKV
jgi:hypothetical protein